MGGLPVASALAAIAEKWWPIIKEAGIKAQ
jgi:hypothetical protein